MKVTVSGRFTAETRTFSAGTWSSAREAAIAYDRVVLFLGLDKPLNFPKESKRLGPASPEEMRLAARVATLAKAMTKLRNGFLGVSRTGAGNYQANPKVGVRAGVWHRAEDAALARDRVVLQLGLAHALNFPEKARALGPASAEQMRQAALRASRGPNRFRGVEQKTSSGRWTARLDADGHRYGLGTFSSAEEAARAYDEAAWNLTGNAGILNFAPPDHAPTGKPPVRIRPPRPKSRWIGVRKENQAGKFTAFMGKDERMFHLGAWTTAQQAAVARDRAELYFNKNGSKLNFPDYSRSLGPLSPKELLALSRVTNPRSASGYQGIGYYENADSWFACVVADGRSHKVGTFDSAEEAARARDRLWLHHGLDRSLLNFPHEDPKPASAKELQAEVRRAFKETTSSRYRGVYHVANKGHWTAQIKAAGRFRYLGKFDYEIEAAHAYDEAALRMHQEPVLNFPAEVKRRRKG